MNIVETIKRHYLAGRYNLDVTSNMYVGKFVVFKTITPEQYKEITNEDYEA